MNEKLIILKKTVTTKKVQLLQIINNQRIIKINKQTNCLEKNGGKKHPLLKLRTKKEERNW